jgi:hypothetical protein
MARSALPGPVLGAIRLGVSRRDKLRGLGVASGVFPSLHQPAYDVVPDAEVARPTPVKGT